ncbi:MAG: hypothetical protein R2736_10230 [Solirubrobacterales bacterium]
MGLEQRLALGVLRSRQRIVVPRGAVSLDDQPLRRPAEVRDDLATAEPERAVDVRVREAAVEEQVQDDVLELAARRRRPGGDDAGESADPATRTAAPQFLCQPADGDPAQPLRPPNSPAQRLLVDDGSEVEQGPQR